MHSLRGISQRSTYPQTPCLTVSHDRVNEWRNKRAIATRHVGDSHRYKLVLSILFFNQENRQYYWMSYCGCHNSRFFRQNLNEQKQCNVPERILPHRLKAEDPMVQKAPSQMLSICTSWKATSKTVSQTLKTFMKTVALSCDGWFHLV